MLTIDCPICRSSIQAGSSDGIERLRCPVCDSSFVIDSGATRSVPGEESRRRVGKFELLEELGAGTFGTVYRARDLELDRIVAIKLPRQWKLASPESIARFLREGRSVAGLKHPGIVSLYDIGRDSDGTCFLVSEFIQGATLADHLTAKRMEFRRAASLVREVAEAIEYAHRAGVVHRDIKPSNIMIDLEGKPHIMDFGLARREADEIVMTHDGQVLGTPAYMSPEQARGSAGEDHPRSDVYSLGVILYQLLTGEIPFVGNARMVIAQLLADDPRPPRNLNDRIPRDLETICLKAMAKTPAQRYASAQELADDLRRYLRDEPILARPAGAGTRILRWCRKNPVAVTLLLIVTAGSAIGSWHISRLSTRLVRANAIGSARQQADILDTVNAVYSARIVDRVKGHGIEVSHDYAGHDGAIPLPATLLTELGAEISAGHHGMEIRHYSDYPFRSRLDGGAQDEFEREALRYLREHPEESMFARFEEYRGKPSLRFAAPRRMKESCVNCHNTHPESTKTDWKVDDMRGVLEIIHPLDEHQARAREAAEETFILLVCVTVVLVGISVAVTVLSARRRRVQRPV